MASGGAGVLLALFAVYAAAKTLGWVAGRMRIPAVVGEILGGVLLANTLLGPLVRLEEAETFLPLLAELGVVFLLFTVGLETPFEEMRRVGTTSLLVAVAGVVVPFAAGYGIAAAFGWPTIEGLFLGAALVATSIGITASVLAELGVLGRPESRIILGAAVLDDVLGLTVLTIVEGIGSGGSLSAGHITLLVFEALLFVGLFMVLGGRLARRAFSARPPWARFAGTATKEPPVLALAVAACLGLAAFAAVVGLAGIIGAFLAGMAFAATEHRHRLVESFESVVHLLVPFFFAYIGLQLHLASVASAWVLVLLVTAVALVTKLVGCGAGALALGRRSAFAIGIGMMPRGEVGIVVALVGLSLGTLPDTLFGVVVAMSLLTTVVTPPLLQWAFRRLPPVPRQGAA